MLYKKKGSSDSQSEVHLDGNTTLTKDATGLDKYTEYEFQVLAFTSVGDGQKSSVEVERTLEDGENLGGLKQYLICTYGCMVTRRSVAHFATQ